MRTTHTIIVVFIATNLLAGCLRKESDGPGPGHDAAADSQADVSAEDLPLDDTMDGDISDALPQEDLVQPDTVAEDLAKDTSTDITADTPGDTTAETTNDTASDVETDLAADTASDTGPDVVPECEEMQVELCFEGPAELKGVGVCTLGQKECLDGTWGPCVGYGIPSQEVCDKLDNDCNGAVDELGEEQCGIGQCSVTVKVCVDGQVQPCIPLPGEPQEACNGIDDTCDGVVDETCECIVGDAQECYTGSPSTLNIGVCVAGIQTCVGGEWSACENEVLPGLEMCDGLDNNCDGVVDEGNPQGDMYCEVLGLLGQCSVGNSVCEDGVLKCLATATPQPELCDGLDNNCNGLSDEGNPGAGEACFTGAYGVCSPGLLQCESGALTCLPNLQPSPEICDGLDNNCCGEVDENNPGGGSACNTGLPGVCAMGTLLCASGALVCNQATQASAEVCDGQDNNCNGQVDENNPGGGASCNTGLLGVCSMGATSCVNGAVTCNQAIQPAPEVCDGLDNNCNGQVDEGNPGGGTSCNTGLPGECAAGALTCSNGALMCVQLSPIVPEVCDGLDNNCDGAVDNNAAGLLTVLAEDFSDNTAGWTLGTEWQIGPAAPSPPGALAGGDPATDHTPTADNGVAGMILGGNYGILVHQTYYLTSPVMNTAGLSRLQLDFWRWLVSDYPPFVRNVVEISTDGGSTWIIIWVHPNATPIIDNTWNQQSFDLSSYNASSLRIRFGTSIGATGAMQAAGWNLDDISVSGCQ